jgi:histidinol-phosphatase (PHP family)
MAGPPPDHEPPPDRGLPPDGHVHTEWSWDTTVGSMEQTCARAIDLGLPSIAFTDHCDFTRWHLDPPPSTPAPGSRENDWLRHQRDGWLVPPPLDVDGYLATVERCRDRFPSLRILTGTELGEPHWHPGPVRAVLTAGRFDRVLGSVHSLVSAGPARMVDFLYGPLEPGQLIRAYLAEVLRLAESDAPFAVLAHIDYPVRHWPAAAGPFDPAAFEDEYRTVLATLARSGRALELNTVVPLPARIVRWWHEAGGEALAFGSDAHQPASVAREFARAAGLAEAAGFRPGRHLHDLWRRAGMIGGWT